LAPRNTPALSLIKFTKRRLNASQFSEGQTYGADALRTELCAAADIISNDAIASSSRGNFCAKQRNDSLASHGGRREGTFGRHDR
jgi:hypothetical protein